MEKIASLLFAGLFATTAVYAAPESKGNRPDFSKLCQGKAVNTKITATHDGRSINGTCQLGFKANNPNSLERGAHRDSNIQNACHAKAKGAAVTVKYNGKNIPGTCDVLFKSEMGKRS